VVASADGSDQKVIVPFGGVRTHPGGEISWSPKDELIAFGTQDGKLSVIRADGADVQTIDLQSRGFAYGPTWSPDGQWLLVTVYSDATDRDDLFLVALEGSEMVQLTDTPEVEAYTDWGAAR
jgi:Tol biopolymer transport system component